MRWLNDGKCGRLQIHVLAGDTLRKRNPPVSSPFKWHKLLAIYPWQGSGQGSGQGRPATKGRGSDGPGVNPTPGYRANGLSWQAIPGRVVHVLCTNTSGVDPGRGRLHGLT